MSCFGYSPGAAGIFFIHALTKLEILFIIIKSSGESVNPDHGFALFSVLPSVSGYEWQAL